MNKVAQMRDRLKVLLPTGPWEISNGQRTLRALYVPASNKLAATESIEVVAQFWMMAPFKRITFEFAGDKEQRIVREKLAEDFRDYLVKKGPPNSAIASKGSAIFRFYLDQESHGQTQMISELDKFVSFIRYGIEDWISTGEGYTGSRVRLGESRPEMSGALAIEKDGLSDLEEAPPGTLVPDRAVISGVRVVRNQKVRDFVIRSAGGKCEFCEQRGFQMKDGQFYLEAHHIILLSSDGSDTVDNVIALCADHHRQAHYGAEAEALEKMFIECIKRRTARPNKTPEPTSTSVTPRAIE